jgi:hypothetical protein
VAGAALIAFLIPFPSKYAPGIAFPVVLAVEVLVTLRSRRGMPLRLVPRAT